MKNIYLLLIIFLLSACGAKEELDQNPTTIEGKRALLDDKKNQLKDLEADIAELTEYLLKNDPSLEKKKKQVTSIMLSPETFTKHIDLEGVVIADNTANAVSETPGRITNLLVKEGDYVKKGNLIATLDMETYQTQKNELLTNLTLARDVYERQSKLWAQDIGSEIQYLQAKNNKERLDKSLELINLQLSKGNVYAPISGVVDREFTKQGEIASPGMPIVQILDVKDLKVQVDLPERYLSILKKGMKVDVYFPSLDRNEPGRVSLIGRSIDPANRTLKFEVDVPNRGGLLKPNLLAELRIVEKEIESAIIVPLEMVQQDVNNDSYVMSVMMDGNDKKAHRSDVKIGDVYEGKALIEEGLVLTDVLIDEGARLVSDGELILVRNVNASADE